VCAISSLKSSRSLSHLLMCSCLRYDREVGDWAIVIRSSLSKVDFLRSGEMINDNSLNSTM